MIRQLEHRDLDQLPTLHAAVWGTKDQSVDELQVAYHDLFPNLYIDHPWKDPKVHSLVHVEDGGRISGLIGVMTRAMKFEGTPIQTAISSNLCVDPQSRSQLVGVQLLKQLLNGPQDLSLADMANAATVKIWKLLGGSTAPLYSLEWVRPLRPFACGTAFLRECDKLRWALPLLKPATSILDRIAARTLPRYFKPQTSHLKATPLTAKMLLDRLPTFTEQDVLKPIYNQESIDWIWERTAHLFDSGQIQRVAVNNAHGVLLGWYIYNLIPKGIGQVAHIVASERTAHQVIGHLFDHAAQHGAVGLSGRVPPAFMQSLSDQGAVFHRRGATVLIHSRRPELLQAFQRPGVFLTSLEGEGCLPLHARTYQAHQLGSSHPLTSGPTNRPPESTPASGKPFKSSDLNTTVSTDIDHVQNLIDEATE